MEGVRDKAGPRKEERLIQSSISIDDIPGDKIPGLNDFFQVAGPTDQSSGVDNPDQYRYSSRIANDKTITDAKVNTELLRENSIARQLYTKENQPAVIRLIRRKRPEELATDGKKDPSDTLVPWENLIPPNTKFFLETVQESREEKVQVIDTFGQWVAFFFGARPEVYNYTGTLLNAKNHNWKNDFQSVYDQHLRGSQAVKNRATVFLQYDDVIVEGYILNVTMQMTAMSNHSVPFSFSMLIINRATANPERFLLTRFDLGGSAVSKGAMLREVKARIGDTSNGQPGDLSTYLIIREYFAGNFLPNAGKSIMRLRNNILESGSQPKPGQVGGLVNPKDESNAFLRKLADSIETSQEPTT